ncbi:hypothetical protein BP5796_00399 [Coleophoma crateriformis]|uniref:Uncharacterized protein n=1 Tax=Coleophoma crateriformis TaxID=565419 RepID=A0A3D8T7W3_9HELO|nr:hypothetical protein BP5796_00399 [Coleophoma crateriformis]
MARKASWAARASSEPQQAPHCWCAATGRRTTLGYRGDDVATFWRESELRGPANPWLCLKRRLRGLRVPQCEAQ